MYMYILQYLKWVSDEVPLYSTGKFAPCCVVAWMGEEFGGEQIHVCTGLSPFAVHLKLSQHC